jgi:hypothetical protein
MEMESDGLSIWIVILCAVLFFLHRHEKNAKLAKEASQTLAEFNERQRIVERFSRGDLGYSPWRAFDEKDRPTDRKLLEKIREIREPNGSVYVRYKSNGQVVEKCVFVCDANFKTVSVYGECWDGSKFKMKNDYYDIKRADFLVAFSSRGRVDTAS